MKTKIPLYDPMTEVTGQESEVSKSVALTLLCALLLALTVPAAAQQPKKVPRIGYLSGSGGPNDPGPQVEAFRQKLQDLGYLERKNMLVEYRYLEGRRDWIPALVAELVRLKVDALVVTNLEAIREAKEATKTIPIVMVSAVDPVATGIVDSLAHPGGISPG